MNKEIIQLREVITKLVPLLAGKHILVTQRGASAFVENDPRTNRPVRVNIPMIPDNADPSFVRAVAGFIDHEVAHVLLTNWDDYYTAGDLATDPKARRLQNLINIVEDTMIEREIVKIFPGSRRNISDLRKHFVEKITKPAMAQAKDDEERFKYLLVPVMRALAGHEEFKDYLDREKLWALPQVDALVKGFSKQALVDLPKIKKTKDSVRIARELDLILHPPQPPQPQPQPDASVPPPPSDDKQESDQDHSDEQQSGEGEGKGEREHTQDSPNASGDEPAEGDADDKPAEEGDAKEEESEKPEGDEADNEPAEDDPEAEDDEADADAGAGGDEEADEGEDDQSGSGADDADRDDDAEAKSGEAGADAPEPDEADDDEQGNGQKDEAGAAEGDEADAEGDEGEGDENAAGASGVDSEADGDDDADGEEEGQEGGQGSLRIAINDDDHSEIAEEGDSSQPGGGVGNGAGKSVFDYEDDAFNEADISSQVAILLTQQAVDSLSDSDYNVFTRELDRIEVLTPPKDMDEKYVPDLEDKTRSMIGRMQKDIERMMAAQSRTVVSPGQRAGRLHAPNLHRLLTNDDRIFYRKEEHRAKNTAVTLLIDNSGSMGGSKIMCAMISGFALGQTLERINVANEILGFTTGYPSGKSAKKITEEMHAEMRKTTVRYHRMVPIMMPVYKTFDERINSEVKRRIAYMANGQVGMASNVDGESLEYAAMRLLQRREQRKVMIVLSDGQPSGGQNVSGHLKLTTEKLEKLGIDLVGIGIQDRAVERFYKNHMVISKPEDLPALVMGELRSVLTR